MRKVLIVVVVLAVLLVAADRVAAYVAAGRVEQRLADEGFADVNVRLHGFPFLTQVARRELRDVSISAAELQDRGRRVVDVDADLGDVTFSDGNDARAGTLIGHGVVPYAEVVEAAGIDNLELEPGPDGTVRVSRTVRVFGSGYAIAGHARVQPQGDVLRLVPTGVEVTGGGPVDDIVSRVLSDRIALEYRIPDLPEGLVIEEVTAGADGFRVDVAGQDVLLARP